MTHAQPRNLLETAERVVGDLANMGYRLNPSSRLMRMLASLKTPATSNNAIPSDSEAFLPAVESVRDMLIFYHALGQLTTICHQPDVRSLLRRSLGDTVLPQDTLTSSPARDAQHHLSILAQCYAAGLTPTELLEPDVQCHFDSQTIGLAAKRCKSDRNVPKQVESAFRQIARADLPGVVVMDATPAINPSNRLLMEPFTDGAGDRVLLWELTQFISRHHHRIASIGRPPTVLGVIFRYAEPRLVAPNCWDLHMLSIGLDLHPAGSESAALFDRLRVRLATGLPGAVEL